MSDPGLRVEVVGAGDPDHRPHGHLPPGPFRLDARQFKFVAEDCGKFFERHVDFQDVATGIAARLTFAVALLTAAGNGLADFAVPLPYSAGIVLAVTEMRHIELRQRNADQIAPFAADHLAMRNVLTQVLANLSAHNVAEATVIVVDVKGHKSP